MVAFQYWWFAKKNLGINCAGAYGRSWQEQGGLSVGISFYAFWHILLQLAFYAFWQIVLQPAGYQGSWQHGKRLKDLLLAWQVTAIGLQGVH